MGIESQFGNFFKGETKSSGRKLFTQEKVAISSHTDTEVQAYVRASPALKVSLTTEDMGHPLLVARCACPLAKRNQFCKHIWAVLLATEEELPDFLSAKVDLDKSVAEEIGETELDGESLLKLRASTYRKERYAEQKARMKEKKDEERGRGKFAKTWPIEVEESLSYFAQNGFPMAEGPSEIIVSEAKRKLSRIFHPDKGGSHEEMTELNRHCETVLRYLA